MNDYVSFLYVFLMYQLIIVLWIHFDGSITRKVMEEDCLFSQSQHNTKRAISIYTTIQKRKNEKEKEREREREKII